MLSPVGNIVKNRSIQKITTPKSIAPLTVNNKNDFYSIYDHALNFRGYCGVFDYFSPSSFDDTVGENYFQLGEIALADGTKTQALPDKNQLKCARSLYDGKSVLFATGTGNGKTAVAHYIMTKNLLEGKKSVYTVPIKALANDKYREFVNIYGKENVGLLTGEMKINPKAPIVIMITEIYDKQMSPFSSSDNNIATVIYDEAHFISDENRGPAWENSIINCVQKGIQTLFLSATIGNSEEFCSWIQKLNPDIKVDNVDLGYKDRNVPLKWYLFKDEDYVPIYDSSDDAVLRKIHTPKFRSDYPTLVSSLDYNNMLPAIIFKQSQSMCDEIATSILYFGIDLTNDEEKQQIRDIIDKYKEEYLFLNPNVDMLENGFAVHHAGKLPQERKLVEELFSKKLLKVIVATSTLGAGINMPARTAVISSCVYSEYDPVKQERKIIPLTANEFHQMAGRAGRRGIDSVGNVVLYNLGTPREGFRSDSVKQLIRDNQLIVRDEYDDKIDELALAYELLASEPDKLRSQFGPQAPLMVQYFEQCPKIDAFYDLINKSFKVHLAKNNQSGEQACIESLLKRFKNYSTILLKQGFLIKDYKGDYILTPKGHILKFAQGANPLLLASLIYDEKLASLNPLQLAQVAGFIGSSDNKSYTDNLSDAIYKKLSLKAVDNEYSDFRNVADSCFKTQEKITRSQLEAKLKPESIEKINVFSAYVSYLWAKLNSQSDNALENFKDLLEEISVCPQNAYGDTQKEYKTISTQGRAYMIIAQGISVLNQIDRICDFALSSQDLFPNTDYWVNLKENTIKAIELVKKEPFVDPEDM